MSLRGGAQWDRYPDDRENSKGNERGQRTGFRTSSYSSSDEEDDYYKRRGKHRNINTRHHDSRDTVDSDDSREYIRKHPPRNRRYSDDHRFPEKHSDGRSSPSDRYDPQRFSHPDRRTMPERKHRDDSPSNMYDSRRKHRDESPSSMHDSRRKYRDESPSSMHDSRRKYRDESPSSINGRDSRRKDERRLPAGTRNQRDYPLDKNKDLLNSPTSRLRNHRLPYYVRNNYSHYSPPDRKRDQRSHSSPRYEDPWDSPHHRRNNDRRQGRPRSYSNKDYDRDSPPHRSEDSLDSFPGKHGSRKPPPDRHNNNVDIDRKHFPSPGRDNQNLDSKDKYEDPWDTPNKNIFNIKDKPADKVQEMARHDTPGSKKNTLESSPPFNKMSNPGNQPFNNDTSGRPAKQYKVKSLAAGRSHAPANTSQSENNTSHTSQGSKRNAPGQPEVVEDEAKLVYGQDENEERGNWTGKFDFILSMLGYAVGLGNVWRFPYLCYRNGGGAFLFPFLIMMFTIGLPLFYLEAALGQFTSSGAMTCWHFAPLFKGLGIAMVAVSGMTSIYYNMIIGWSLHYMFSSFTSDLPFASCQNKWNTENCKLKLPIMTCEGDAKADDGRCLDKNGVENGLWNKTLFTEVTGRALQSPSQEYWERFVLNFSDGIEHYGQPKWDLVLCLLLAWIICFLCLIKGIKTTGKVVYFTALFPYVVLIILLFRGVTLENADIGIKYFITPNFARLADAGVWKDAANQVFFSLSIGGGGLITLSSYNRFHNNILRDSLIVAVGDSGTCILGGFVIFSYLGYMAGQLQVGIEDVAADGAGLAFVVYPEAVSSLPPPTLWAILFFIMLLTLGLDTQFAMVETVLTATLDQYPMFRPRKTLVILVICIILFILGLPLTCPGGMYLLQLMDNYVGGMTLIIIGFVEIIAVVYIYGVKRFCQDIHIMTGSTRFLFWKVTWLVLSPLIIAFIFIFMFVDYKPSMYDTYTYPTWADVFGWFMTVMCVLPILVVMVFKICKEKEGKSIWQKLHLLCLPTVYWGPALKKHRALVHYVDGFQIDPFKGLQSRTYYVNYAFDNAPETSTKSDSQASLGVSRISIISATSKSTAATAKSGMTYESNV